MKIAARFTLCEQSVMKINRPASLPLYIHVIIHFLFLQMATVTLGVVILIFVGSVTALDCAKNFTGIYMCSSNMLCVVCISYIERFCPSSFPHLYSNT